MPLAELFVEVRVGVVAHLADPVAAEPEHDARALIHHVLRVTLQPALLPDLDNHAVVGLIPVAPHVLVAPVRRAEAGLAVPEGVKHALPAFPLPADPRPPAHPVDDVVGQVAADPRPIACDQRFLVALPRLHSFAHTIACPAALFPPSPLP